MKRFAIFCLLILPLLLLTTSAEAWSRPTRLKLRRGVINVVSFPLEIPKQTAIYWKTAHQKEQLAYPWIISGAVKGVVNGVGRLGSGLWDIVTFNLPIPEDFEPLMEPEYVYEGFEPEPAEY